MSMDFYIEASNSEQFVVPKSDSSYPYHLPHSTTMIGVRSMECCAVLEIWNMRTVVKQADGIPYVRVPAEEQKNLIKQLMHDEIVVCTNSWSDVKNEKTNFILQCTIADYQKCWKPWLLENGWIEQSSFVNPNTGKTCTTFLYIPNECKVSN